MDFPLKPHIVAPNQIRAILKRKDKGLVIRQLAELPVQIVLFLFSYEELRVQEVTYLVIVTLLIVDHQRMKPDLSRS